ncbi:Aste57867_11581 [Aphanomyces stellatus]|uniref:Aste57867_11581 protein n=1 Tax=Aphanomyces stellatus TaxID=120398 RepID=A0A485KTN3_9STRA|nr:hypothetical protein As57867_011538 [Aphanomyces stellatus]VFT88440.1 Aste57867_11581 [Aphanomyces stellatus]
MLHGRYRPCLRRYRPCLKYQCTDIRPRNAPSHIICDIEAVFPNSLDKTILSDDAHHVHVPLIIPSFSLEATTMALSSAQVGVVALVLACVLFGASPLFFYQLQAVPSIQVLCHQQVWSFVVLLPTFVCHVPDWSVYCATVLTRRNLSIYFVSAMVLGGSWLTYLLGVMHGNIVETSLGYFMNPILGVVLAVVVFKEALRPWQYVSVALALSGILVIAVAYGTFPFLGVGLGVLFATYAMIKKLAPLPFMDGVMLELTFLVVPCGATLLVLEAQGTSVFLHSADTATNWLLVASGVVTVVPLLLYAYAAPLISFTLFSFLQYLDPSLTFVIGVWVYHEEFSTSKLVGFVCVWVSLLVFTFDALAAAREDEARALVQASDSDDGLVVPDLVLEPSTPTTLKATDFQSSIDVNE